MLQKKNNNIICEVSIDNLFNHTTFASYDIYPNRGGSKEGLDEQSKGIALALMSIAKKQRRNFVYIPFATTVGKVREYQKGKIKPNDMIELASEFMNGGTNFMSPLNITIEVLSKDKYKDADIIFVTDGVSHVSVDFIKEFKIAKKDMRFSLLSLVIGGHQNLRTGSVEGSSDRVVGITSFNEDGAFEAFEI